MISTVFYERRKTNTPIDSSDRRTAQRRNNNKKIILPESRRLASRVRRYEREAFKIPVYLKAEGGEVSGYTHNISPDGLLIFSSVILNPGTPISLQFLFGEGVCYLNISGRVVFCLSAGDGASGEHSIGIKFSAIREWEQKILISAVQELKQSIPTYEISLLTILVSEDTLALESANFSIRIPHRKVPVKQRATITKHEKRLVSKTAKQKFTPHPEWITELSQFIEPYRRTILESRLFTEGSLGILSLKQMRAWMIQLYPFIEMFPKFLALQISKSTDSLSRGFLIDNIRVEKKHAEQWIYMAQGFGIDPKELFDVETLPEVDALTHWMWSINTHGTLAEAVSATTYAIEGVTQDIAKKALDILPKYDGVDGIKVNHKTTWWLREHARYDDSHPLEALEIIKLYANTRDVQEKVKQAAKRSLEYLFMALEACYIHFAN